MVLKEEAQSLDQTLAGVPLLGEDLDAVAKRRIGQIAFKRLLRIMYNKGPVDKSKNSAETHSGSSRTVNLEIAKDGIYHPLEV